MRFLIRKRRQAPTVIIVALIDVLIVLLIFLLVTTTARKKPMARINIALPESTHATNAGANENPPLIISIESNGNLRYGDAAKPVTPDELQTALTEAVAQNPQLKLTISADKNAPWGRMVLVTDTAKTAKVKPGNVTAFIKPAGNDK